MIKRDFLKKAVLVLAAASAIETGAQAQIVMTMEQALEYSAQHNPE